MTLTPELRARIDDHLDAVEKALLAAGHSRARRRGVVDDLEAQIQEMLAAKSESPTRADLEEVLARLDPPAAYADGSSRPAPPPIPVPNPVPNPGRPAADPTLAPAGAAVGSPSAVAAPAARRRYSRTAIWGCVCILASLTAVPLILVAAFFFAARAAAHASVANHPPQIVNGPERAAPRPEAPVAQAPVAPNWMFGLESVACAFVLIGPLAIAGTILGWISLGQIRNSAGAIRGTGLALFDGLFYPTLVVISSVITPFFLPIVGLVLIAACIALIILVVRLARGRRAFG